eukprot:366501-Chlamydomonas_euryale.AAC.14
MGHEHLGVGERGRMQCIECVVEAQWPQTLRGIRVTGNVWHAMRESAGFVILSGIPRFESGPARGCVAWPIRDKICDWCRRTSRTGAVESHTHVPFCGACTLAQVPATSRPEIERGSLETRHMLRMQPVVELVQHILVCNRASHIWSAGRRQKSAAAQCPGAAVQARYVAAFYNNAAQQWPCNGAFCSMVSAMTAVNACLRCVCTVWLRLAEIHHGCREISPYVPVRCSFAVTGYLATVVLLCNGNLRDGELHALYAQACRCCWLVVLAGGAGTT